MSIWSLEGKEAGLWSWYGLFELGGKGGLATLEGRGGGFIILVKKGAIAGVKGENT